MTIKVKYDTKAQQGIIVGTKYAFVYDQTDWGTSRFLRLLNTKGQTIASADPFYTGIPIDKKQQVKKIADCAITLYKDYVKNQIAIRGKKNANLPENCRNHS